MGLCALAGLGRRSSPAVLITDKGAQRCTLWTGMRQGWRSAAGACSVRRVRTLRYTAIGAHAGSSFPNSDFHRMTGRRGFGTLTSAAARRLNAEKPVLRERGCMFLRWSAMACAVWLVACGGDDGAQLDAGKVDASTGTAASSARSEGASR